jgi:hypothetical protein
VSVCFYNDYEWTASIVQDEQTPTGDVVACEECGREITATQWRHRIFMQEHEECQICAYEDDPDPEHAHDYGEVFHYHRCLECDKILRAVEDHEAKEGCPPGERQPALGLMRESLMEFDQPARGAYAKHAREMFPELADNPLVLELEFDRDE